LRSIPIARQAGPAQQSITLGGHTESGFDEIVEDLRPALAVVGQAAARVAELDANSRLNNLACAQVQDDGRTEGRQSSEGTAKVAAVARPSYRGEILDQRFHAAAQDLEVQCRAGVPRQDADLEDAYPAGWHHPACGQGSCQLRCKQGIGQEARYCLSKPGVIADALRAP
jgi:hypothetical protein